MGDIKGDTRRLDYGSARSEGLHSWDLPGQPRLVCRVLVLAGLASTVGFKFVVVKIIGYPKYKVPYYNRDPKRGHHFVTTTQMHIQIIPSIGCSKWRRKLLQSSRLIL